MSKSNVTSAAIAPVAYSVEGVTKIVPCGKTTIFAAIKSGDLQARKMGRRTVILEQDLRAWLLSLPIKRGGQDL